MAKKKFNISSTLNKNKKEAVELAPKVPLKKKAKDPEEIKIKVEEIHSDESRGNIKDLAHVTAGEAASNEKSEPAERTVAKPKTKTKAASKKSAPKEKARMVRMTIDTPEEMHLQLKIKSIQSRMSMRDYVLRLIEKDLKKG